jgi:hypothetical protein
MGLGRKIGVPVIRCRKACEGCLLIRTSDALFPRLFLRVLNAIVVFALAEALFCSDLKDSFEDEVLRPIDVLFRRKRQLFFRKIRNFSQQFSPAFKQFQAVLKRFQPAQAGFRITIRQDIWPRIQPDFRLNAPIPEADEFPLSLQRAIRYIHPTPVISLHLLKKLK